MMEWGDGSFAQTHTHTHTHTDEKKLSETFFFYSTKAPHTTKQRGNLLSVVSVEFLGTQLLSPLEKQQPQHHHHSVTFASAFNLPHRMLGQPPQSVLCAWKHG